jgi:NAD(P)H-hydrate epimerase
MTERDRFRTPDGTVVPAVTTDEMRSVDRVAVETVGLTLPRMMEHAGRTLAMQALEARSGEGDGPVVVLAGGGGNGGGGLVCARHLANREVPTTVVLDREPTALSGVPGEQLDILGHTDASVTAEGEPPEPSLVVDALLGYGLRGAPRDRAATLVEWTASAAAPVLSLDVPSGVDATTGERPGVSVRPDLTLTLARPKTGLTGQPGRVVLADLSIPKAVYEQLSIPVVTPFGDRFRVSLTAR